MSCSKDSQHPVKDALRNRRCSTSGSMNTCFAADSERLCRVDPGEPIWLAALAGQTRRRCGRRPLRARRPRQTRTLLGAARVVRFWKNFFRTKKSAFGRPSTLSCVECKCIKDVNMGCSSGSKKPVNRSLLGRRYNTSGSVMLSPRGLFGSAKSGKHRQRIGGP